MATLCNYTSPGLFNTSGLERQGHGVLFPYNPEFYDLTSGLYGPGTIIAWNLLFVSLVVNSNPPENGSGAQISFWAGMSGELVAFVAYPMFAATDLLVRGIRLIGHENRADALYCLRTLTRGLNAENSQPSLLVRDMEYYPQDTVNLADIPPDILSLGQRVVEATGPLDVSYSCFPLLLIWAINNSESVPGRPHRPAVTFFLGAGTAYVFLVVFIFQCTLGDFVNGDWEMLAALKLMALEFFKPKDKKPEEDELSFTALYIGAGFLLWWLSVRWFGDWRPTSPWVPDIGVALSEQDQLAAVIAASMSLSYTIYTAWRRVPEEAGDVALEENLLRDQSSDGAEAVVMFVGTRRASV
ncbi:hypothetical protein QBC39DRAFT_328120 [Podospora conica]|nr:hypothetical protein QBC39DRAFT_328120 [Schizothecium conicum]